MHCRACASTMRLARRASAAVAVAVQRLRTELEYTPFQPAPLAVHAEPAFLHSASPLLHDLLLLFVQGRRGPHLPLRKLPD